MRRGGGGGVGFPEGWVGGRADQFLTRRCLFKRFNDISSD